jgi:hypothetical protein
LGTEFKTFLMLASTLQRIIPPAPFILFFNWLKFYFPWDLYLYLQKFTDALVWRDFSIWFSYASVICLPPLPHHPKTILIKFFLEVL